MNKVQKQIPPPQDTLWSEWARHNKDKDRRGGPERESESERERGVDAELKKEVEGKREKRRRRGGENGREEPCEVHLRSV